MNQRIEKHEPSRRKSTPPKKRAVLESNSPDSSRRRSQLVPRNDLLWSRPLLPSTSRNRHPRLGIYCTVVYRVVAIISAVVEVNLDVEVDVRFSLVIFARPLHRERPAKMDRQTIYHRLLSF